MAVTYKGRVVNGTWDGTGTCHGAKGGMYDGEWRGGVQHGRGVQKWANGAKYEGEWHVGKWDGWGVYLQADGCWFEGLWRENHLKRGTWHHANSVDVKDGEWAWNATKKLNEMQGWGVQRRTTTKGGATGMETVYEGGWDSHKWHGVGTWRSPDGSGDIYRGQFDHGMKCGTGSILFGGGGDGGNNSKGGSYVGGWKDNAFHGRGVRLWANGDRYDGQWVQGKEHGDGTKTWSRDGSSFTGLWVNGVPIKGMRKWPNGDLFEGTFTQNGGNESGWECRGEGVATLSQASVLKGSLNNNLLQSGNSEVQHKMGSLPQFEHHQRIEKLRNEHTKQKSDLKSKMEEMQATEKEWQKVTERNNQQHAEQLNEVNKKRQQLQDQLQALEEISVRMGKAHPELKEAFALTTLFQSQLHKSSSEFVLLEESLEHLNQTLQGATESNTALTSRLRELTELKATLATKLNESDDACKKLLGQTLTVQNCESEIQECSRNISTLTKKVLTTSTSERKNSLHVLKEGGKTNNTGSDENTVDDILMKPLLTVNEPQLHQRDDTFTPPFQLLCTLSDTLAQLQRCQFEECTKLANKHTVLSKELSEQETLGGTLRKAIEETQRECSELQREHKGKWEIQQGLEGDEKFIGMPCVWSMLSELLPQAQQAMFDLIVSKATLSSSASPGAAPSFYQNNTHTSQQPRAATTLPGCTATSSLSPTSHSSSMPNHNDNNVCIECDERPPNVQLQPCGHVVACSQCAAAMKKCPECRSLIKDKVHL
ncbi:radial spoke head protein [Pelomyxa schiedti]|nr:radial spoke head protein [Pelomyxa schiedti]